MKNITLSVDDKVLSDVRRYAAARNTTVNGLVRKHLEQIARNETRAQDAMRELREMSDRSDAEVGRISWKRDDLYER
jgi:hypothetical protein